MALYKNYIIKQGETLESISQKFFGTVNRSSDLIPLNKLRYPYISDNVIDQLGPKRASASLSSPIAVGATSINLASFVSSGKISSSVLTPQSVFFIQSSTTNGEIVYEKFPILSYYPFNVTELNNDGITNSSVAAGTVKFDTSFISSPTQDVVTSGLVSTTTFCKFTGSAVGSLLTVSDISSGIISIGMTLSGTNIPSNTVITGKITGTGGVGTYTINTSLSFSSLSIMATIPGSSVIATRSYYIRYTYVSVSGETLPSPYLLNETSGAAIPYVLTSTNRNLLVVSPPVVWPTGAIAVRVYIGTTPQQETYQATFSSINDLYVEPVSGIVTSSVPVPTSNTSKLGFQNSYNVGTPFFIFDNPTTLNSKVLKTGDTIIIPSTISPKSQIINNNAKLDQFIDTLGVDLKLDSSGFLTFDGESGADLSTVTSVNNVKQAILGRLVTKLQTLSTQPNYGNTALSLLGAKYSANFLSIIRTAIIQTVKRESRISSIDNIAVSYDSATGSVIVKNLALKITRDGTSGSEVTFSPIALPI